jgi:hypothetical protein
VFYDVPTEDVTNLVSLLSFLLFFVGFSSPAPLMLIYSSITDATYLVTGRVFNNTSNQKSSYFSPEYNSRGDCTDKCNIKKTIT